MATTDYTSTEETEDDLILVEAEETEDQSTDSELSMISAESDDELVIVGRDADLRVEIGMKMLDLGLNDVDDDLIGNVEEDPFPEITVERLNSELNALRRYDTLSGSYVSYARKKARTSPHIEPSRKNATIEDVIKDHALAFLPAKSLSRLKTVSKGWNSWISSLFFSHKQTMQFNNISGFFCQAPGEEPHFISLDRTNSGVPSTSLELFKEPVYIRATCNGLLCFQRVDEDSDGSYYVGNPVNKYWSMLPKPNLYHGPGTAIAIAFEPSFLCFSAHFELVCAVQSLDFPVLCFEIYSSRSNSWRQCNTMCCELNTSQLKGDGFYMSGFVFWETLEGTVLAFDVKNEEYGILLLPHERSSSGALTAMNGELHYILPRQEDDVYNILVYGNTNFMSLKHIVPLTSNALGCSANEVCRALPYMKDETFVIVLGEKVIAYDAREQTMNVLSRVNNADGFTKFLPFVNSLVMPLPSKEYV